MSPVSLPTDPDGEHSEGLGTTSLLRPALLSGKRCLPHTYLALWSVPLLSPATSFGANQRQGTNCLASLVRSSRGNARGV